MGKGMRITGRWRALFTAIRQEPPSRRRLLLVGSDVGLTLTALVVIAVLASMLIGYGDVAVMGRAGSPPLFHLGHTAVASPYLHKSPLGEIALEHSRKHVHPGYQCPQHPEVISESPGICPVCGEPLRRSGERDGEAALLETSATVMAGQMRLKSVPLFGGGWIDHLLVNRVGAEVRQGDLLLEVYAPNLLNSAERMEGLVRLYAPVAGRVRAIHAEEGKFVASGTVVMQVEDSSSLWLKSDLSAAEAERVRAGQRVEISLPDTPGTVVMGEVDEVVASGNQGVAAVWLRFDDHRLLRTLSQVSVRIHAKAAIEAVGPG